MKAPVSFPTHPNAPAVVNFYDLKGTRKFHNRNPRAAKYASQDGAQWVCDQMNAGAMPGRVWYVVT